ncbi:lysophospholipid acyltransferase family protein [Desulfoplanes formicivorans]|uniref:1-acyl-sn-glycerol-3-phosphate acyltransferase n=1 Tax=Desulfoplanes formicivorans TaxID=1592317 RepID=A0A194ABN0_9BACT|nr:lysophospholipid acyltransferase family protein [Desulfoplanes formicivorans]GAU07562.1 1-acyl-sn-glycerol-3-phosphate acyltransferase [Desulfoplanes formicivorans]
MFRSIYAYTAIILSIILGGTILIPLSYIDPSGRSAYRLAAAWARFCVRVCGITLETDLKELDPDKRYIFVANHQSQVDIPILMALFARFNISFLAKHSLFSIPVLGRAMRNLGCVPIDRTNPRKALRALSQAISQTGESHSFLVFPEGTRNQQLGQFKPGAIIMALKSKRPIVPVVIDGSGRILPKGSWRITPGTVRVFGMEPIEFQGNSALKQREALTRDVWNLMNNKLLESSNE